MQSGIDPTALGFTVVSLSVALEETLKALAEKTATKWVHGSTRSKT